MTSNHTQNYHQHDKQEAVPYEWFAWTFPGAISQMTLGTISTCSSALILYIIYKSPVKLKSTYHRIMALLSTFDVCLSSALALGTLPIPESSVPYSTPTLGTTGTCMVQGSMIYIGGTGVIDATLCLAWYYVCRILCVSTWTITRIYEPIFYICIIVGNANVTFSLLKNNWINIQHWTAYCNFSPIPTSCWLDMEENSVSLNDDNDHAIEPKCQWPTDPNDPYLEYENFGEYYAAVEFSLIVLAMLIVILVVYQNERKMANDDSEAQDEEGSEGQTRDILYQASMFVFACLATWYFLLIDADEITRVSNPRVQDVLQTILTPLGGFWNMLIFVHIKIRLIRDSNHDIKSNFEAFMIVITEPDSIPDMVLSGMENVMIDDDDTLLSSQEESSSSHDYTSHPSAYDELLSNSKTPSRSIVGSSILSATSSILSFMLAPDSNSASEDKLGTAHNTIPSYGAVNNHRTRTVRFAVDDEEVAARARRIRRPMRRSGW